MSGDKEFYEKNITKPGMHAPRNSFLEEYNKAFPQPQKIKTYSKQHVFKIIVIGDSNVGKTCLTYRFCEGKFPDRTEATIGVDFREKTLILGNEEITLRIWDTAGQEKFRQGMIKHYYRNAHAVLFVYDVTKMSTFDSLPSWMDECQENGIGAEVPKVVVGNKCDSDVQIVHTNLAQRFADSRQMALFETSAKDNSMADHVESIFLTIAHKLKSSKSMLFTPINPDIRNLENTSNNNDNASRCCWLY